MRLEALAWPRFQSIECGLLASLLTLPTAPATYNMSSGGSQTLPHAHCMPPYRWRSKCCGRTPMTEDMSTRPRPRLRAARLTLGRWCALQAVRRMAVAPEPTGASAEGSSPAPLLCDVLSYFGYPACRSPRYRIGGYKVHIARYSVRGTKYTSRHTRIGYTGLPASTPH